MTRIHVYTLALLACFSAALHADSFIPTNGLVGYWPLDGDAADLSGNGHHGSVVGDITFQSGVVGQAAGFDEGPDHITFGAGKLVTGNQVSVNFWMKSTDTNARPFTDNRGVYFYIRSSSGGAMRFTIATTQGHKFVQVHPDHFADDQWHMITTTYDGAMLTAYIDGQPMGSQAWSGDLVYQNREMVLGRRENLSDMQFTGALDDVALWDRALSPAEISQMYASVPLPGAVVLAAGLCGMMAVTRRRSDAG